VERPVEETGSAIARCIAMPMAMPMAFLVSMRKSIHNLAAAYETENEMSTKFF
jgi:hypothetical protein